MADNRQEAHRLHQEMVNTLRQNGAFNNTGVEAAFVAIPRHLFLPAMALEDVYSDRAIGIKTDTSGLLTSSSSQPTMMAIMLEQLGIERGQNVLEIGTATGYNAAIMQHIVGETGTITTLEIDKQLATNAQEHLRRSGQSAVNVVNVDAAGGYAPRASYDRILSTVGVWDVPSAWLSQLKPQGALVVPIVVDGIQISARFVSLSDGTFISKNNRPCAFVYMLGQNAGPAYRKQVGSSSLYILANRVNTIDTAALHTLLSNDHEINNLESRLEVTDYWYGFQIYQMLNVPPKYEFFVYSVIQGQKAYGLEGRGMALLTTSSASFANYADKGVVHTFAGADAYLAMQDTLDKWEDEGRPSMSNLRLCLIPKSMPRPDIARGRLFERRDHYLHAWMEV
ncbi:MAG: class I SAM-dependent methyltransferase [Chloroflexota bacterium]